VLCIFTIRKKILGLICMHDARATGLVFCNIKCFNLIPPDVYSYIVLCQMYAMYNTCVFPWLKCVLLHFHVSIALMFLRHCSDWMNCILACKNSRVKSLYSYMYPGWVENLTGGGTSDTLVLITSLFSSFVAENVVKLVWLFIHDILLLTVESFKYDCI